MSNTKPYYTVIGSPVDYEKLVAYVFVKGKCVALINQDNGTDDIRIELLDENTRGKGIEFNILIEALHDAKRILLNE
ncbi:hypothetical protein [Hymenobacter canadensis]|uniref:DUF2283 domain-containing protein n=1 Tax=Hymenobacter canadensis TaxID=2999067 RepID=A0ABY7LXS2_9BACT|nr:hypothetical protein [Hymenobacter canadensis]WBA43748.1 hypothetical protein O3303_09290 [Hymenobacter canadensis]